MKISRIHHAAYRCKDAKETVEWYAKNLNMDFVLAIAEDLVPSTKAPDPYMHIFLDAGGGNVLAFFELPNSPEMGRDENTPGWVQHMAFAVDSMEEAMKVAQYAPGSDVFVRILVDATEAEWPLSKKFGCDKGMAVNVFDASKIHGLNPIGISFHIGSQTRHPEMWDDTLAKMADVWNMIKGLGYNLTMLNLGGGFPAYYGKDITDSDKYGAYLVDAVEKHFGDVDYLMAEPGRGMVGNAGYMAASVLLVSQKSNIDTQRWVYLDVGKFSGLAETDEEAIKYQFVVPDKDGYPDTEKFVMAGPTCDSADVLYSEHKVTLPATIAAGDKIIIKNCGAYTTTYSTVAFNGFPPLGVVVL